MKLIDILVRELPKRGGWPDGVIKAKQSEADFQVYFYDECGYGAGPYFNPGVRADDCQFYGVGAVHKSEYEAALAASKVPVWNGEGLPPLGCEVEIYHRHNYTIRDGRAPTGTIVKVVAHETTTDGNDVAVVFWCEDGGGLSECLVSRCLRPILTEAERKREEAIANIWSASGIRAGNGGKQAATDIYEAICAGKIPGIRLTDDTGSQ